MKLTYDAIIFDFDGVLVDTVDIKTQGFVELFKQYGNDVVKKVVDYHIKNGGISRSEKFKYYYKNLLHKDISYEELDMLCEQYSALTLKPSIDAPWILGAKEFLEANYKDKNFYIVSGISNNDLHLIVKKRKMRKYFKGIVGSPPAKEIILKNIIEKNYYKPTKTLYLGDSLSDIKSAEVVGLKFIGVGKQSTFPPAFEVIKDFTEWKI